MVAYFTKLFTEEVENLVINIPNDVFPKLTPRDWESISRSYSTVEIDMVIKQMGYFKALGPNRFQALFHQKNWDVVAPNVHKVVMDALKGGKLPDHLNETHIVLLPKSDNPELASQFRPIGLCHVAYKIITKIIVNCIKPNIPF